MPTGLNLVWTVLFFIVAGIFTIGSAVFVVIGWIGPKPRFSFPDKTIVVTSPWATTFFSLGLYHKKVVIEPALKVLHVEARWFWFAKLRKRVEFDWIASVAYVYRDASWIGRRRYWGPYQEEDVYTIGVWLSDGEMVPFFRFVGAGQWVNNSFWPDWMYASNMIGASITEGHAGDTSQGFADRLAGILGKPVRMG